MTDIHRSVRFRSGVLKIRPYGVIVEKVESWLRRWQEGDWPWDRGREHPLLNQLFALGEVEGQLRQGCQIFVPGCGRAHDAATLASKGYEVLAVDFIDVAVEQAKKLYSEIDQLSFLVQDVCKLEGASFDAVFDCGMLCAIHPSNRIEYIESLVRLLRPGGLFLGILFSALELESAGAPPYILCESDVFDLFAGNFDLVSWESHVNRGKPLSVNRESLCIWRKL